MCREAPDQYGADAVRSQAELAAADELPPWLGDDAVRRSHRSALVRKELGHYRRWFPDVPPDLPYVWPPSDRGPVAGPPRRR